MKLLVIIFVSVLTISCSGKVKQVDCKSNDWRSLGYEVAANGKSVREFDEYKLQCPSVTKEEQKMFMTGYKQGLKVFCQYDIGYELAKNDFRNPKTCPTELRAEFDRGFRKGSLELAEMKKVTKALKEESEKDNRESRAAMDAERQRAGMARR